MRTENLRLLKSSATGVIFSGPKIYIGHREGNVFCWIAATDIQQVNEEIAAGRHVMAITEGDLMTSAEQRRFNMF